MVEELINCFFLLLSYGLCAGGGIYTGMLPTAFLVMQNQSYIPHFFRFLVIHYLISILYVFEHTFFFVIPAEIK